VRPQFDSLPLQFHVYPQDSGRIWQAIGFMDLATKERLSVAAFLVKA